MPPPSPPPSGKKSSPAEVIHFPKKPRSAGRRRNTSEVRAPTKTPPDVRGKQFEEDPVTEPEFILPGGREVTNTNPDKPIWVDARPTLAHHKGQVKALLSTAKKGRAKQPGQPLTPKKIAERSMYGHEQFQKGKLEEAKEVFEELVELGVEQAYAHTMLGTIYLALDQQDRALELFETALALESTDIAARVYRGEIRLNRGKVNLALDDLQLAVRMGQVDDPFVERAKRLIQLARDIVSGKLR